MAKLLPLSRGLYTIVDDADFVALSCFRWHAQSHPGYGYYAARRSYNCTSGKDDSILMHRQIMEFPIGVDHRNGDGLDNRRANLRVANQSQNAANSRLSRNNTSGFVGVHYYGRGLRRPWTAHVTVNRKTIHLGYFATSEEAAKRRDAAAIDAFGEFCSAQLP
jgi:hypothetical protein